MKFDVKPLFLASSLILATLFAGGSTWEIPYSAVPFVFSGVVS
jgi:hypothetical protein